MCIDMENYNQSNQMEYSQPQLKLSLLIRLKAKRVS